MIVPYLHTADFPGLEEDTAAEMMLLAQRVQAALARDLPSGRI